MFPFLVDCRSSTAQLILISCSQCFAYILMFAGILSLRVPPIRVGYSSATLRRQALASYRIIFRDCQQSPTNHLSAVPFGILPEELGEI